MNTIIITTDFSAAATNAAKYAAELACTINVSKIILYHSYYQVTAGSDVSMPVTNLNLAHEGSMLALEIAGKEVKKITAGHPEITVEVVTNRLPLEAGVRELIEQTNAELVVAGATGKSDLEKLLVGSNTVILADSCAAPLLIIPADYKYQPIHQLVFACDLKRVNNSTPVMKIDWWLKTLQAKLLVLNVAPENKAFNPETISEQYKMHDLLDVFNPDYHYAQGNDIAEEITAFAEKTGAGLIITVPKSYGFFEGLFRRSISKQLTRKSEMPLLVLREVQ